MHIKARNTVVPILAFSFLALGAMPKADDNATLSLRVQVLETQVQEMKGFMEAQKKAASETLVSLKEAEQAGFTAGINPRSREILLSAWRAEANAAASTGKKGKSKGKDKDKDRDRDEKR